MRSKEWRIINLIAITVLFTTFALGQAEASVKIISKPKANYPKQGKGTICVQGTVTLRIQFLGMGKIGKISVVSGLPFGLNESSIEAAQRIKFEPAKKAGKPVTAFKLVQYNFTLY